MMALPAGSIGRVDEREKCEIVPRYRVCVSGPCVSGGRWHAANLELATELMLPGLARRADVPVPIIATLTRRCGGRTGRTDVWRPGTIACAPRPKCFRIPKKRHPSQRW